MSKQTTEPTSIFGRIADLNDREFQFIRNRYDTDGSIRNSVEDVASMMSISAVNAAKYSIRIKIKFGVTDRQFNGRI